MNLTSPRRSHPNDDEQPVPVELPHVLVTVASNGTLTATVDGTPFPAPGETAWTRTTFGPLMDAITKDRTVAVRVEVRECDGSVFTDIIRPRTPRRAAPLPESIMDRRSFLHATLAGLVGAGLGPFARPAAAQPQPAPFSFEAVMRAMAPPVSTPCVA